MARLTSILDELVVSVPAAIRAAGLNDNACILATRMGVEALRACGIRARPLTVALTVMNPVYVTMLDDPNREDRMDHWRDAGAWAVVLGHGGEGGLNGHVVLIADERYLVDLTAMQVRRLVRGIKADAFWHEAREMARNRPLAFSNEEDGCVWLYEPRPHDKAFLRAPAWSGYRVSVRGGAVISERSRLADVPVAKEIRLPLPTGATR